MRIFRPSGTRRHSPPAKLLSRAANYLSPMVLIATLCLASLPATAKTATNDNQEEALKNQKKSAKQSDDNNFVNSFNHAGMPTSRHSAFEVCLLQNLTPEQQEHLKAIFKTLAFDKTALGQELVDLLKQEANDYPELSKEKLSDQNLTFKTLSDGQYPQFRQVRWQAYAEVGAEAKSKGRETETPRAKPKFTVAEYKEKETVIAGKFEKLLDSTWLKVKPLLTRSQLNDLDNLRNAWDQSAKRLNDEHGMH